MTNTQTKPAPSAGTQHQVVLVLAGLLALHADLPAPYITILQPTEHGHLEGLEMIHLQVAGPAALEAWREALLVPCEELRFDGRTLQTRTTVAGVSIKLYAPVEAVQA